MGLACLFARTWRWSFSLNGRFYLEASARYLCLQEVFSVYFQKSESWNLKSIPLWIRLQLLPIIIPFCWHKDCHGGLATFSVFPREEKFYEYQSFPGMRWGKDWGLRFLLTKIDLPSGKIWVVNTHLFWPFPKRRSHSFEPDKIHDGSTGGFGSTASNCDGWWFLILPSGSF